MRVEYILYSISLSDSSFLDVIISVLRNSAFSLRLFPSQQFDILIVIEKTGQIIAQKQKTPSPKKSFGSSDVGFIVFSIIQHDSTLQ